MALAISPRTRWSRGLLTGLIYFACAVATILPTRFDGGVAYLWIATAFLTARLAVVPPGQWWPTLVACVGGSFLATTLFGAGVWAAIPLSVVNVAEAATAVWLLRKRLGHAAYFESVEAFVTFVVIAGGLIPALLSVPAAAAVAFATQTPFLHNLVTWAAGHALGTIAFTPMAMLIVRGEVGAIMTKGSITRCVEILLLFAVVALITFLVFDQSKMPLLFLPMLPMMIVTMRLGRLGAAGSTVILMVVGGYMTVRGTGPVYLVDAGDGARAQFFQFYVAVAAMLVLPLAALLKQRKELANRLAQSEAGYRLMAQYSGDAILNLATDGTILYASPAARDLGGFDPDALVGRNARDLVVDEDVPKVVAALRSALNEPDKSFPVQYRAVTANGRHSWFETIVRAVLNDRGAVVGAVSASRDITARKAIETNLIEAAQTDVLTGLTNRRGFEIQLQRHVSQLSPSSGPCAVAIFDLDYFKRVNDTHGHAAGDTVLRSFAATAWRTLRENDLVGRLGGEEFGVVLWNTEAEDAVKVCDRLRAALSSTPVRLEDGVSLIVTASVGVAALSDGQTAVDVLRVADEALYEAKREGRNRIRLKLPTVSMRQERAG